MNISQVQSIARDMGIKPGKLKKADLIHAIQLQEGAFDCFGTAFDGICDQESSIWRKDCFQIAKQKVS